ncbi:MAG: hypothetical protein CMD88_01875 [Gammaproteobacteria bacterium]|nr:hypothetical protein [Gammaproteobacteria bacterium]
MKLSAKGSYAIKAMLNIAMNSSKEPKTLLEIAKYQGISLSYLEQLFALLRKNNLVSGVRGPGGGYKLSAAPEQISVAQIIKAIHEESISSSSERRDEVIWNKFNDKLYAYLDTVTLDSLMKEDINGIVQSNETDTGIKTS